MPKALGKPLEEENCPRTSLKISQGPKIRSKQWKCVVATVSSQKMETNRKGRSQAAGMTKKATRSEKMGNYNASGLKKANL